MDWIILTISEYIFTFFVETASFEIVFPKGGCFVAQIIGRCYNANINKYLKEEQGYEKESNRSASGYGNGIWLGCMWKQCRGRSCKAVNRKGRRS